MLKNAFFYKNNKKRKRHFLHLWFEANLTKTALWTFWCTVVKCRSCVFGVLIHFI